MLSAGFKQRETAVALHMPRTRPALGLFRKRGFHKTSMRDIARAAEMSPGAAYHYFPSKASEGSHYQLYNLAEDPFESTNLAASRPDQLRLMMHGLIDSLEAHDALSPVEKNDVTSVLKPILP